MTESEIKELYTPVSEAVAELQRRRNDQALSERVTQYFAGFPTPPKIASEPCAIIARPICTPNIEFTHAVDIQQHLPIRTLFYEFTQDRFVTNNSEKCSLLRLTFVTKGEYGALKATGSEKIASLSENEGKAFKDIQTFAGESLVAFHHRIFKQYFPNTNIDISDFNGWFGESESFDEKLPYLRYLGLFIRDAILLEDFTPGSERNDFTLRRVKPAFKALEDLFGVRPLIVPLAQYETVNEAFWYYYPESIKSYL